MSDHTQTHDQNIVAWQEQIKPLVDCARVASEILGAIEAPLGALYNQAEQAGDQDALDNVMVVWEQSQHLAKQIPPFVAALESGAATIEELKTQRDAIAGELTSLVKAVETYDTEDPRIAELAEIIQEDVYEMVMEDPYLYDAAYEEVWQVLYDDIAETFGVKHLTAINLVSALRGDDHDLTDYRRELILHLLKTFEAQS